MNRDWQSAAGNARNARGLLSERDALMGCFLQPCRRVPRSPIIRLVTLP